MFSKMTRSEARMIAEELFKLLKGDGQLQDEWLKAKDAADYLGVSVSWLNHNGHTLPRTKVGNSYRYPKSKLNLHLHR